MSASDILKFKSLGVVRFDFNIFVRSMDLFHNFINNLDKH